MSSPKILFLEPDPLLADSLESALDQEGYTTVRARDGAEALGAPRPALAIIELNAPVLSGLEYLQWMSQIKNRKDSGDSFPVIAIARNPTLLRQALDLGVQAVLQKPFSMEILLRQVSAWLSRDLASVTLDLSSTFRGPQETPVPFSSLEPESCLASELWLDQLACLFDASVAKLQLKREGEMLCLAAGGEDADQFRHRRESFRTSLSARAYESAESLWFSDLTTIPLFSRSPWVLEHGLRAAWMEPCRLPDFSVGAVLSVAARSPRLFTHLDAALLRIAAQSILRDALEPRPPEAAGLRWREFVALAELMVEKAAAEGRPVSFARLHSLSGQSATRAEARLLASCKPREASFCWVDRGQAMSIHLGTDPDALRLGLQDQGLAECLTREGASFWGDVPRSLRQWRQEVGAGKDFRVLQSA